MASSVTSEVQKELSPAAQHGFCFSKEPLATKPKLEPCSSPSNLDTRHNYSPSFLVCSSSPVSRRKLDFSCFQA